MSDKMTKQQRSKCMSHIHSRDTTPEIVLRKELFRFGFRFRKNVRSLPGTPDIVLSKYHTCIFINGCFWHGLEDAGITPFQRLMRIFGRVKSGGISREMLLMRRFLRRSRGT